MEYSQKENIFVEWFFWQFYEMPKFLFTVWNNYLNFAGNLFSVKLLLKTLFSPWRKYIWRYPKGFDITEMASTFVSNIFSRVIGAMLRVVLIIFGIVLQVVVGFVGLIALVLWVLLPFLSIFGIIFFFIY